MLQMHLQRSRAVLHAFSLRLPPEDRKSRQPEFWAETSLRILPNKSNHGSISGDWRGLNRVESVPMEFM